MFSFTTSTSNILNDFNSIIETDPSYENASMIRAHFEYLSGEYVKWVKSKIDMETSELLLNDVGEKKQTIRELKDRISLCDKVCSSFKEMQIQMKQMKQRKNAESISKDEAESIFDEYEKKRIVVEQQKLQLKSDVHFLIEKETPFIDHCLELVTGMMQRSVSHSKSILEKEPPNYLINRNAPFSEGKEDSEIDFTVSAGGFHILPLSIKKGREIVWNVNTFGNDINLRLIFRDEKSNETVIEPFHVIGGDDMTRGSYMGVESGMLEMLFDNKNAYFRSKKIHMRLGIVDEVKDLNEEDDEGDMNIT